MSGWCEACPVRLETRAAAAFPRGGARLAGPIEYACGSAVSCPGGAGLVSVCCGLSGPVENRRGAAARVCLVRLRSPVAGVSRFVAVAAARFVAVAADWVCLGLVRRSAAAWFVSAAWFGVVQRGRSVRCGCGRRCVSFGCGRRLRVYLGSLRCSAAARVRVCLDSLWCSAAARVRARLARLPAGSCSSMLVDVDGRVQLKAVRPLVLAGGYGSHRELIRKTPWSPCKNSSVT